MLLVARFSQLSYALRVRHQMATSLSPPGTAGRYLPPSSEAVQSEASMLGTTNVLDGSPPMVSGYRTSASSPAFLPSLDALQVFRVETSNLSPTVAGSGSEAISMVTKSGTDRFGGSAFTFVRPGVLDANDPFVKASQAQLGLPNSYWNASDVSTFGRFTYASSTPRQVQLALRFTI